MSFEAQRSKALARFHAYHTRPSTIAAEEFLGKTGTTTGSIRMKPLHWETLPERVAKLSQVLSEWVSEGMDPKFRDSRLDEGDVSD